jgi:hypothetical protein
MSREGEQGDPERRGSWLAKLLKTTPEFWMNLQNAYDLYEAKHAMTA